MSEDTFGIVVEHYDTGLGVWQLFEGDKCGLSYLDYLQYGETAARGELLEAFAIGQYARFRKSTLTTDCVSTKEEGIVIRTIVYCPRQLQHCQDEFGIQFVLLISHDIGYVRAPKMWVEREMVNKQHQYLLLFVRYEPVNLRFGNDGGMNESFWRIIEERMALDVNYHHISSSNFLEPSEVRRIPAVVIGRDSSEYVMWSPSLGNIVSVLSSREKMEIGQWMEVDLILSSIHNSADSRYKYTVTSHQKALPYVHPEVGRGEEGHIEMTMTLTRSPSEEFDEPLKLWNELYGLSVDYDDELWILKERRVFRAVCEITLRSVNTDYQRVDIKAVRAAPTPAFVEKYRSVDSGVGSIDSGIRKERIEERKEKEEIRGRREGRREDDRKEKKSEVESINPFKVHQQSKAVCKEERRSDNRDNGEKKREDYVNRVEESDKVAEKLSSMNLEGKKVADSCAGNRSRFPRRLLDNERGEEEWAVEMKRKEWKWPLDRGLVAPKIEIPDGEDGWEYQPPWTKHEKKKVEPVEITVKELKKKRIMRDAMQVKFVQCLVSGIIYSSPQLVGPEKIELYVMDGTPTYIVHKIKNQPQIASDPNLTTLGNLIRIGVKRTYMGYHVYDDQWVKVGELKLPIREVKNGKQWRKHLEIIVEGRCISSDGQDRLNEYHRYNNRGFILFTSSELHNIAYFDRDVDPKRDEGESFQMVVMPEECLENHVFWRAIEVLSIVEKPSIEWFDETPQEQQKGGMIAMRRKEKRPLILAPENTPKTTVNEYNYHDLNPVSVPRETRIEELMTLYSRMLENESLMDAIHLRTGMNYRKKLRDALDMVQVAVPNQKSMKRELQVNADFLVSLVDNMYMEEIFRSQKERRLFKMLVKTSESIKAFRSIVNNR